MKKMIKKTITLIMIMMLVLSLTSCRSGEAVNESTEKASKVVMTYVPAPFNVPSIVDQKLGFYTDAFGKAGIETGYSEISAAKDQRAALASGDIQILNGISDIVVLLDAANGGDVTILSMYSRAPESFAIFSNDENINSPADLKGLTIAGPKGSPLHQLLSAYLASGGLTLADVDFVDMTMPLSVSALAGGSVDAALVTGAAAMNLEKAGKHKITDGEGYISGCILTAASGEFAENNPETIEAFLTTQKEIVRYVGENKDASMDMASEALDTEKSSCEELYEIYDFDPEITAEDIEMMKKTEEFLFNSGMIENHVDVESMIYR